MTGSDDNVKGGNVPSHDEPKSSQNVEEDNQSQHGLDSIHDGAQSPGGSHVPIRTAITESELPRGKELGYPKPRTFNGNRAETEDFLNEVALYLEGNAHMYPSDSQKKTFTLSCISGGTAQAWKNNMIQELLDRKKTQKTYDQFLTAFKLAFEPYDIPGDAQRRLRELKMTKGLEDFINQFMLLAKKTKYNNTALIEFFQDGILWPLAESVLKQPGEDLSTIDKWVDAARRHYKTYQTMKAVEKRKGIFGKSTRQNNGKPKNEVSINRLTEDERKDYMKKGMCFRCSKTGHRSRECPSKGDNHESTLGKLKSRPIT
ncbi:hypothetical protein MPER_12995 [Moniliophthora perniciosa FA553]|nr:hypothetical protein MPER_12995 [Moniliophthora perniciosa FA553]